MKILIVSAYFHPFTHPRAHRWSEIAANWAAAGHEVHVVTAKNPTEKTISEVRGATVHRAGFASLKEAFNYLFPEKIDRGELSVRQKATGKLSGAKSRFLSGRQKSGTLTKLLGLINDVFWRPFYWPDDAALWYFPAKKLVQKLAAEHGFDAIVTVSMPFTGHLLGLFLKKNYPGTTWLVDIGDPICFQRFPMQNPFFYKKLTQKVEKRVLQTADIVTVTNTGLVELYQKKYGIPAEKFAVLPPISTATNFDENKNVVEVLNLDDVAETIQIGYFGSFFRGVREPDLLLDFIRSIPINWRNRFNFHVFGAIFHEFEQKLANVPGLEIHGMIPRDAVFSEMQNMDFLLNIGNADAHQLPSKLADYLIVGLPIINLCQLENDSFLTAAADHPVLFNLKKAEGGFTQKSIEQLLDFIEKNRGARLPEDFLETQKQRFSAQNISEKYLKLIETNLKNKKAKTG